MPKASNFYQSDRPESGGADKDMIREKTGLHEQDKQKLAQDMAEKAESVPEHPKNAAHDAFTVGNEPNNAKGSRSSE